MGIAQEGGEEGQALGGAMSLRHRVLGRFAAFSKQLFFR